MVSVGVLEGVIESASIYKAFGRPIVKFTMRLDSNPRSLNPELTETHKLLVPRSIMDSIDNFPEYVSNLVGKRFKSDLNYIARELIISYPEIQD